MGFRRPSYLVAFPAGSRFHGLEVRTRSVSFDRLMQIQRAVSSLPASDSELNSLSADEGMRLTAELADSFAEALVSWNLEDDDGTPVPPTAEALRKEDGTMVLAVVMRWLDQVINVDEDLGKGSASGPPSPAVSLPMEPLSASPASS